MKKIIKFESSSCQPCKQLDPVIDNVVCETGVVVEKVSMTDPDSLQLFKDYNVRSVPTLIFIGSGGYEHGRLIGLKTKEEILEVFGESV